MSIARERYLSLYAKMFAPLTPMEVRVLRQALEMYLKTLTPTQTPHLPAMVMCEALKELENRK